MKIPLPVGLKKLASLLPSPVYLVGGYVRDALLGLTPHDADLAGDMSPETIVDALQGTEYIVKLNSLKLMTLKILCSDAEFEYTAFRTDSYRDGHAPIEVKRTSDINTDALRRDFTMNAIYYDVTKEEVIDPLNGREAIAEKTVILTRDNAFTEDGLRLIRLCRQAAELGFSVPEVTLTAAKTNRHLIKDISPERIRDELDKILIADCRYNVTDAHLYGLRLLDGIGVLELIFPELTAGKGMVQRADFHSYDVFEHSVHTYAVSDPSIRLAGLLHDVGKPFCFKNKGSFLMHDVEGERIVGNILHRLRYPNSVIKAVKSLVRNHMYDLKCDAGENSLRKFILRNQSVLKPLLLLKQADFIGSGKMNGICPTVTKLNNVYEEMLADGTPFTVKDLKVNGKDLQNLKIEERRRGEILKSLLTQCVFKNSGLNDRESQLKFIEKKAKEENNG